MQMNWDTPLPCAEEGGSPLALSCSLDHGCPYYLCSVPWHTDWVMACASFKFQLSHRLCSHSGSCCPACTQPCSSSTRMALPCSEGGWFLLIPPLIVNPILLPILFLRLCSSSSNKREGGEAAVGGEGGKVQLCKIWGWLATCHNLCNLYLLTLVSAPSLGSSVQGMWLPSPLPYPLNSPLNCVILKRITVITDITLVGKSNFLSWLSSFYFLQGAIDVRVDGCVKHLPCFCFSSFRTHPALSSCSLSSCPSGFAAQRLAGLDLQNRLYWRQNHGLKRSHGSTWSLKVWGKKANNLAHEVYIGILP